MRPPPGLWFAGATHPTPPCPPRRPAGGRVRIARAVLQRSIPPPDASDLVPYERMGRDGRHRDGAVTGDAISERSLVSGTHTWCPARPNRPLTAQKPITDAAPWDNREAEGCVREPLPFHTASRLLSRAGRSRGAQLSAEQLVPVGWRRLGPSPGISSVRTSLEHTVSAWSSEWQAAQAARQRRKREGCSCRRRNAVARPQHRPPARPCSPGARTGLLLERQPRGRRGWGCRHPICLEALFATLSPKARPARREV